MRFQNHRHVWYPAHVIPGHMSLQLPCIPVARTLYTVHPHLVDALQGSGAEGSGSGQTREHAQLARSLGVEQLAVVVSKLDMAGYSQVCVSETLRRDWASCNDDCCLGWGLGGAWCTMGL
jgi:sulfate adenylyltransferase subunit 1 (EFTu-like GTPase family)